METTATFYFSTRTLAVSDITPITAPVSDMTTTAAVSIFTTRTPVKSHYHNCKFLSFPQGHKHFWHEHNSTSIWHDHNIKFLSYIQEHQQFDMETTASFYFSTRTLAVSGMTPITAPVSDMTTTAAVSIFTTRTPVISHYHNSKFLSFPQEHKHFSHEHNSTSIWHDHIKFLSYIQEHQQFDMETTASFYFSTRTLAVSDITPSNSTSLWHDHNSSSFYLYHMNTSNITSTRTPAIWPQQQVSIFSTRTQQFQHFWHANSSTTAQHQHLTWPQHQVSILYTRTPAIWHGHHSKFLL